MRRTAFIILAFSLALAGCARADAPATSNRLWSVDALADLKRAAEAAPVEGLVSEQAALEEIARLEIFAEIDAAGGAQVDLTADALFSSLARSFAQGGADPAQADRHWQIPLPPAPDLVALHAALAAGASPSSLLLGLLPRTADYRALRAELARTYGEAPGTLDANGSDRETRIIKLRANMERWRWLPRNMPARRVEVRIAQLQTTLYRPGAPPAVHSAIVGARRTPTPTFAADILSVTLNPSWRPPSSILHNELLPRFRRNPAAAARDGFDAIGPDGDVIDSASVDWNERPFPYRLRQRPGSGNALGRFRFDFPNPNSIYLHDTANRSLFARTDRALSHGCIRVEDPAGLAEAMISAPEWDAAALRTVLVRGATRAIPLSTPTPIFVLYLTTSTSEDGAVTYLEDLYDRDAAVVTALDAEGVASVAASEPQMQHSPL